MKYNFLANTGVLVSELCLGTMSFGGKGVWQVIGRQGLEQAQELVKTAYEHGVNFIDTADVYSEGESEILLGQALKNLGISRYEWIIATKVRSRTGKGLNQVGLSRLHLMQAVEESLKRLSVDHIDVYYVHGVDAYTPLEDTMRGLEDIVRSGKVRYLGISNHAAWQVMKANGIAGKMGWTPFVALQYYYSLVSRDAEREILPMAIDQNLGFIAWSPLAGGLLSGKYSRHTEKAGNARRDSFDFPPVNKDKAYQIIETMQEIASHYQASVAQVALAWLLQNKSVTSTIMGVSNKGQLVENLAASDLILDPKDLASLEQVSALVEEYPAWMMEFQQTDRLLVNTEKGASTIAERHIQKFA